MLVDKPDSGNSGKNIVDQPMSLFLWWMHMIKEI
jgi:hypothetical protein